MCRNLCLCFLFVLLPGMSSAVGASAGCPELVPVVAKKRMADLGGEIRYHDDLYYRGARPVVSDAAYDRLLGELLRLEGCFPELADPASPTAGVGSSDKEKLTVAHEGPMLSLNSTVGSEAVEALLRRLAQHRIGEPLLVQPKVDGLPVELLYKKGRLVSAATRGDGLSGEDVTERAGRVQGIPRQLIPPFPERLAVRGEVYADLPLFAAAQAGKTQEEWYSTPRYLAAATLRTGNPDPWALAALRFFPYQLVNPLSLGRTLESERQALQRLAAWGFPVAAAESRTARNLEEIRAVYRHYLIHRSEQPFAIDGIVVKADSLSLQKKLGEGRRAPSWAAAWKFPPATVRTTVVGIDWSTGRTGRRTPVAEVAPVTLGGISVARASLHSEAEMVRLGVSAGAEVIVALMGDVIPQIIEVVSRGPHPPGPLDLLTEAPAIDACLSDSPQCREQFLARALHFVSNKGLDIPGLGAGRLRTLIEAGRVTDLPSFFELQESDLAFLPGFGADSARQVSESLAAARRPPVSRLIRAIGIPGIGPANAERLGSHFPNLEYLAAAGVEELSAIPGLQSERAGNVRAFFASSGGQKLLKRLRLLGIVEPPEEPESAAITTTHRRGSFSAVLPPTLK
ncbi:NAD-dependent DNA ligase [Desulfuromonas soudanensis]|uniref:DNA ligase n=1 Tax=Desulfuromonas soudanensis TaxID=1603606 RepID=A0A0M4D582_9BACT|nr:NAD-dependent DNA ligase LigA [Desulfuromonas soudanensis]ALC17964.1 NAD-dependent DNA ligase [Desulfuromonas soudanensis]